MNYMYDISVWCLLIPIVLALAILFPLWKWPHRRWAYLTTLAALIGCLAVGVWIFTWNVNAGMGIHWHAPYKGGDFEYTNLSIRSNFGGCYVAYVVFHSTADDAENAEKHPFSIFGGMGERDGPGQQMYPICGEKLSVTPWPFLEEKLGFQVCAFHKPPTIGENSIPYHYSITFPWWFVPLFCLIPPLGLFRQIRRRRYRIRKNLCLACGFDRRAHQPTDKCPACGIVPKISKTPAGDRFRG